MFHALPMALVVLGLAQRAVADAIEFATHRLAFGRPVLEHPMLRAQVEDRLGGLRAALALAWESARLVNEVWRQSAPFSDRYHLFRLLAHLAKYWAAEFAVQTAKWCMEVHGGVGTLQEFRVERWLREAMILAIWEGTAHRQILDGLEVMERKNAHRLLFAHLATWVRRAEISYIERRVEIHLALSAEQREATAEPLFRELAVFVSKSLTERPHD
jgi:acyl-CoA dehydrogenase